MTSKHDRTILGVWGFLFRMMAFWMIFSYNTFYLFYTCLNLVKLPNRQNVTFCSQYVGSAFSLVNWKLKLCWKGPVCGGNSLAASDVGQLKFLHNGNFFSVKRTVKKWKILWWFPNMFEINNIHSSFSETSLQNLPNLAKKCTFYTKYLNLSSKSSQLVPLHLDFRWLGPLLLNNMIQT